MRGHLFSARSGLWQSGRPLDAAPGFVFFFGAKRIIMCDGMFGRNNGSDCRDRFHETPFRPENFPPKFYFSLTDKNLTLFHINGHNSWLIRNLKVIL
jgi:hypothetical protein